ncbi:hypothetical protein QA601_08610 [Chitinispirillales bacterium ANBcel5]|uniref:hypothetical protein n=1 Tax=Cellulosispirillum alkaliphilum TaxID=3039283 RepID=UPI002A52F8D5|nr:hypothetical protein [Chitinispirillales bacterium ANBcel5]
MKLEMIKEHINRTVKNDQLLIGFFHAQATNSRRYLVTVCKDTIHFNLINFLEKVEVSDIFSYREIASINIIKMAKYCRLHFFFQNGRKLTLKAPYRSVSKPLFITDEILERLQPPSEVS